MSDDPAGPDRHRMPPWSTIGIAVVAGILLLVAVDVLATYLLAQRGP